MSIGRHERPKQAQRTDGDVEILKTVVHPGDEIIGPIRSHTHPIEGRARGDGKTGRREQSTALTHASAPKQFVSPRIIEEHDEVFPVGRDDLLWHLPELSPKDFNAIRISDRAVFSDRSSVNIRNRIRGPIPVRPGDEEVPAIGDIRRHYQPRGLRQALARRV